MTDDDGKQELDPRDTPPWLMPVSDEDDVREGGFSLAKLGAIASIIFVIVSVASLVYLYRTYEGGDQAPKKVMAPKGAVKEKPENPGGKQIPDQDKKIFDQMQGKAEKGGVVNIKQQPEQPVKEVPQSTEPAKDEDDDAAAKQKSDQSQQEAVKKEAEKPAEKEAIQPTEKSVPEKKDPAKEAVKKVEEKQAPAKQEQQPDSYNFYRVQLGSFGSEKSAKDAWGRIKARHSNLTKDMQDYIAEAVVSGRTFFRLSMGPLASRAAADNVCLYFKTKGQACFVVSPNRK